MFAFNDYSCRIVHITTTCPVEFQYRPIRSQLRPAVRSLSGCGTVCKLTYGGPGWSRTRVQNIFRSTSYDHISFIDKNLSPISLMNNSACSFVLNILNNETAGNFFSRKFTLYIFQSLYMIIYNFCLILQSKAIDFLITLSLILGTPCFKYDGKIMMSPSVTLKYH